jgi:hypothetical protein
LGSNQIAKKANEFVENDCPVLQCKGKLTAFYRVTMNAPWPWQGIGFTKEAIKSRRVGITAVDWDQEMVFCPKCGWSERGNPEAKKSEIIMRMMRELVVRGMKPSEIQSLVGNAVSTIDVLGAIHPDP